MKDKKLIEETILLRRKNNDPVKEYSVRNKASPSFNWQSFKPYNKEAFPEIYGSQIDGVKLKFRSIIVTINGRHNLFN
jgi:hypothetical protein